MHWLNKIHDANCRWMRTIPFFDLLALVIPIYQVYIWVFIFVLGRSSFSPVFNKSFGPYYCHLALIRIDTFNFMNLVKVPISYPAKNPWLGMSTRYVSRWGRISLFDFTNMFPCYPNYPFGCCSTTYRNPDYCYTGNYSCYPPRDGYTVNYNVYSNGFPTQMQTPVQGYPSVSRSWHF